jgi:2-oxoglutarate dehydrogenase complex dehydrogenase (E1) component-like enzyme
MCTGKIAYQLMDERDEREDPCAVVRVEQMYPFPQSQLEAIYRRYPHLEEVRWVQEEPENMGAWWFMFRHLSGKLPDGIVLGHAARYESASPATGSVRVHEQEQRELLDRAFA